MIVGIPRALYAYKQPGLWPGVVRALGMPYVVSPPTDAAILERGVAISDGETCLSCKVFNGHCAWLIERGVDTLLIPRYKSLARGYHCCPKFLGLPDIARALFPHMRVIDPTVDLRRQPLSATLMVAGRSLGAGIGRSVRATRTAHRVYARRQRRATAAYRALVRSPMPVGLVSHPYTLGDTHVNMRLAGRLSKLGVTPVETGMVPHAPLADAPDFGWDFARVLYAQARTLLNDGVRGMIRLSACNCGCDAVIGEYLAGICRAARVPHMVLTIDEHTSDGGLQTRVEAFVDTLTNRELRHAACA